MKWQCYVTKKIVQQHSNDQTTPNSVLGMRNAPDVAHAPLGIFGILDAKNEDITASPESGLFTEGFDLSNWNGVHCTRLSHIGPPLNTSTSIHPIISSLHLRPGYSGRTELS